MNKEELIGKLQMVYVGDTNALNELIGYYDGLKQGIDELQQENQKLKEQLQQKEDVINKAKVDLEKHLNAKSYGNHKYELFDRKYLEEVLEILNSKGEQK